MSNLNAILGGVAAAAPGVAQGVQNMQGNAARAAIAPAAGAAADQAAGAINQGGQVQAMTPDQLDAGATGQTPGGMASALADNSHPMADSSHPFWNVMQSVAGAIPATPAGASNTQGLQNGGVVKANYGRPVIKPEFTKGPAVPTGPNDTAIPSFTQAPQAAAVARTGYEAGGVVNSARQQAIQVGVGRDQTGVGQSVTSPSTEGQMLTMEGGGVVPGYADGGFIAPGAAPQVPMTGGPAGFVQGFGQGEVLGRNLLNAFHEHEARKAAADYAGNIAGIDVGNQGQDQQAPSMLDKARDAVEGFFHHLHGGTLNDQHMPNSDAQQALPASGGSPTTPNAGQPPAAIPASPQGAGPSAAPAGPAPQGAQPPAGAVAPPAGGQSAPPASPAGQAGPASQSASPQQQSASTQKVATAVAAQAASTDPQANAGIPQQSPEDSGKPHSLTPDYWKESQQKLQAAVRAAALAGEDPQKVYDSLTAMRTAHFQGQILRQLSAANTALLSGDEKSVRQALSNVNYYLPNGQGMTFKNATAADVKTGAASDTGQLMYRNPMFGLYGHQNEPEYITVTPQHLQLLGAAALDPRTVQDTMLKTYSAQAQAQKEMLQAQGEFMTGQGRQAWGQAAVTKANVDQQLVPVRSFLMKMQGVRAAADASYLDRKQDKGSTAAGPKVTMASIQKAQNDAFKAVDDNIQGQMTTEPTTTIDPKTGQQIPNLSPAAGRSIHNAARVPTLYQGLSPDQQASTRALAGTFAAANQGSLNAQESADMAARVVRAEGAKVFPTHIDPDTKKPVRDVIYDPSANTVHVWVGNGWRNAYIQPNILDAGQDQGIPTGHGGDESTQESQDTEPAIDSQNMSG
jgi:hypothetical protein